MVARFRLNYGLQATKRKQEGILSCHDQYWYLNQSLRKSQRLQGVIS
jgi:hypothetical protein